MGAYSIKDLELLSGIKAHTIRIWEQRYGIIEPKRTETNIRFYDDEQLKYVLNVALLSRHGHKISFISSLTSDQFNSEVEKLYEQTLIHNTEVVLDLDANDLVVSMIDLDSRKFESIYENSVKNNGFERTITHLIYPFLEKIGMLWSIGQINPANEHFISSLIRQKILSGIDRLPNPIEGKKFLLFLPEGELHEIGLMLAHYMLKKRGCSVYYFGATLPEADLRSAILKVKPDVVFTFITDPGLVNNALHVIDSIINQSEGITTLIAMRSTPETKSYSRKNVHFLNSISDLEPFV